MPEHYQLYLGTNWKVGLGGHGPIDIRGGQQAYARLKSPAQVGRSLKLADSLRKRLRRRRNMI